MLAPSSYDVIVVGAGIVGSCTAYHLAKYGKRTLLLEQYRVCHNKGSSHGASRIIRYTHDSPVYLPLIIDAYQQWEALQKTTHKQLITKCGLLWIGNREETEQRAEILKKFSIDYEILVGNEITKKFPHLLYDDDWYALYEKTGGVLHAENCLRTVQEQYKELGGEVHEEEEVRNLNVIAGQIGQVVTNKGAYVADSIVFTVGCWLHTLLPGLPVRTQALSVPVTFWEVIERKELFDVNAGSPVLIITKDNELLYMIPGVDYNHKIKFGIHRGTEIEPWMQAEAFPDWVRTLPSKHISKHLPDVNPTEPFRMERCIYTMSEDEKFVMGPHPSYRNVIIGGGFSGMGFKFGLTTGRILARMAANIEGNEEFDLSAFRVDRFPSNTLK